jgi:hypothetical protein
MGLESKGLRRSQPLGSESKQGEAVRITLANHSSEGRERVFHPDGDAGDWIGNITERFPDRDWALATLHPSISFSNNQIFECGFRAGPPEVNALHYVCNSYSTLVNSFHSPDLYIMIKDSLTVIVLVYI